jgi:hypothetical protein
LGQVADHIKTFTHKNKNFKLRFKLEANKLQGCTGYYFARYPAGYLDINKFMNKLKKIHSKPNQQNF